MTFILTTPTRTLLDEIADDRFKPYDIAITYALALRTIKEVNWSEVNHAILERWGKRQLEHIKKEAWTMYQGKTP